MKIKIILFFMLLNFSMKAQESDLKEFTLEEYLGYVKKFHPLVKQADLKISEAQAKLMKARGAFDPKLEADFSKKEYGDKNYYSLFNGSFKIPTWYGIEVKAAFDNNEGIYLNPENTVPNNGLTSLGISIPLGQGLWINERMSDLRKAKTYQKLNEAERNIQVTNILYDAIVSYINWKRSYDEVELYRNYLKNASVRYDGVLKLIEQGDKAAIDSIEAGITVKTRRLNLENAELKLIKSKLDLSNYIWTENTIPLELTDSLLPDKNIEKTILETLNLTEFTEVTIENHPKLNALQSKIAILTIDRKLQANSILPKLNVSYNYLSEPSAFEDYRFEDYKIGVHFSFPLFLRKERANLKLAKLKVQDTELSLSYERESLMNKIEAQKQEINSFKKQRSINSELVSNYEQMLNAEERLFTMGESSLFLINSRENTLVSAQLSNISLANAYLNATVSLFKTIANPE
ncbi:TolC family protein [Flavobacterium sediminilitoris]|uniref:TolC family protein n=1 Tax=Flavobacterium sediminilitoris TaxID=2024526 RepID=A0ABY4HS73_9FLAO|nr:MULTISPECIES: TolC family protein [Flavobacterium]UOX34374.1 TolC family protein [Flavobacterium sediminilitoris]